MIELIGGIILGCIIIHLLVKIIEGKTEKEQRPTAEEIYSYEEMSDEISTQEWGEMNDMTEDEIADLIGAYRNEQADEDYGWQEDEDRPWRL